MARMPLVLAGAPIGRAADASSRLGEELAAADVVAAEDTRRLRRLCADLGVTPGGRVVLDYDMGIAEPFRITGGTSGFDLWPAFARLAGRPVALVRGETSDLLSADTVAAMRARVPELAVTTVARVGHAPVLDEPEAAAAIDALLARVLAGSGERP